VPSLPSHARCVGAAERGHDSRRGDDHSSIKSYSRLRPSPVVGEQRALSALWASMSRPSDCAPSPSVRPRPANTMVGTNTTPLSEAGPAAAWARPEAIAVNDSPFGRWFVDATPGTSFAQTHFRYHSEVGCEPPCSALPDRRDAHGRMRGSSGAHSAFTAPLDVGDSRRQGCIEHLPHL